MASKNESSPATANLDSSEITKKARSAMNEASEKMGGKLDTVKDRVRNIDLSGLQGRAKDGLKGARASASDFIRDRPLASLGVAVAAGFLVASAFKRRS